MLKIKKYLEERESLLNKYFKGDNPFKYFTDNDYKKEADSAFENLFNLYFEKSGNFIFTIRLK